MTVSIKQLKAFVAVVEEKSFSVAAQRLKCNSVRHVNASSKFRIEYWKKTNQ